MGTSGRVDTVIIDVTPTLTAAAYATGRTLGTVEKLGFNIPKLGTRPSSGIIRSITTIAYDDISPTIDLYMFDQSITQMTDNQAAAITDADAAKCIGKVAIASADFADIGASRVAYKANVDLPFSISSSGIGIYMQAIAKASDTYTASGLKFRFAIEFD